VTFKSVEKMRKIWLSLLKFFEKFGFI